MEKLPNGKLSKPQLNIILLIINNNTSFIKQLSRVISNQFLPKQILRQTYTPKDVIVFSMFEIRFLLS